MLLASTVYNIFHRFLATDEYLHVISGKMEEKGLANFGWQTGSESHGSDLSFN